MAAAYRSRADHFPAWGLWPVLALAAVVRIVGLGQRSLWTDEGSTWTAATLGWSDLIRRCVERDASPPLYYVLTAWALKLGGDGEAQLRLVSLLASLVMVWLAYRLARLAMPRGPATFAALLAALSPYQVMYAHEARTYALAGMLLLASLLLFERAIVHGRRGAWVGYVLVSAIGLYTQTISALGVSAQVVVVLLFPEARRRALSFALAQAAIALLYAPWLWASASAAEHLSSSHWYIDQPEAAGVFKVFRTVLLSPMSVVSRIEHGHTPGLDAFLPRALAWGILVLGVAGPLVASCDGFARRQSRTGTALLWAGWLVPIVAVSALSFRSPLLLPRYFVFAGIPVAALLALGVSALPRVLRVPWGALLVLLTAFGLWRYAADYSKEPWRDVAADIASRSQPGRTAVLVPFDVDPYAFYNRHSRDRVRAIEYSHPAEPFAARYTPQQFVEMADSATARTRDDAEVWVVVRSPNNADRRMAAAQAESVAALGRVEAERRRWDSMTGPLRVSRWVRPAAPAAPDTTAPAAAR